MNRRATHTTTYITRETMTSDLINLEPHAAEGEEIKVFSFSTPVARNHQYTHNQHHRNNSNESAAQQLDIFIPNVSVTSVMNKRLGNQHQ